MRSIYAGHTTIMENSGEPKALSGTTLVPLTEWGESYGALEHAQRCVERGRGELVLAGLLPPAPTTPDPEVVRALLTLVENGFGSGVLVPPPDDRTRREQIWTRILWPAQRKLRAGGVRTRACVIPGDSYEQICELVTCEGGAWTVVIADPSEFAGSLSGLAQQLLSVPPCSIVVVRRPPGHHRGRQGINALRHWLRPHSVVCRSATASD